jgi:hypothetical protein
MPDLDQIRDVMADLRQGCGEYAEALGYLARSDADVSLTPEGGARLVTWIGTLAQAVEELAGHLIAHDPASGPEPATGAPNAAGVDAGSGEAGSDG